MDQIRKKLQELQQQLRAAQVAELRSASNIHQFLKIGIIVLSLVLGVMQFFSGPLAMPQYIGIGAAVGVAFFTLASLLYERDSAKSLQLASESSSIASELLPFEDDLDAFEYELFKADTLNGASRAILEYLDQVAGKSLDEVTICKGLLRACERAIMISTGFRSDSHWTICVYRIQRKDDEPQLVNIASFRAVPCDELRARSFHIGEGVPGIAWANTRPIVAADVLAPELAGAFDLADGQIRREDKAKHRSIAAVPIMVASGLIPTGKTQRIWGMVVASYETPGHFELEGPGSRRVMPFRLLAASMGAAVGLANANKPPETESDSRTQGATRL